MDIKEALEQADAALSSEPTSTETTPAPAEAPPTPAVEAKPETPPKPDRARTEEGKFAKEPKAPKATTKEAAPAVEKPSDQAPHGAAPTPTEGQGKGDGAAPLSAPSPQPAVKAPQSWKPAAREAFAKAPPEVQQEVLRRESEVNRAMQESAEARRVAAQARETLSPYEGLARANGMDPLKYAGSVMQTAATLHMGSPAQKAAVVAQLISSYGIDVDAVNAVMQGQAPQMGHQPAQPPQDVGRVVEQVIQQRLEQATQQRAIRAWEEFQASEPEFLDTVKDSMRVILMDAGQRGLNMTYQDAYTRACKMDEEVSAVLAQRNQAQAVRTPQPVTDRARAAASSVRTQPASMPQGKPKGVRGAMEAAAEKLGL